MLVGVFHLFGFLALAVAAALALALDGLVACGHWHFASILERSIFEAVLLGLRPRETSCMAELGCT